MIERLPHSAGTPIAPRAIFSRPIEYFALTLETAEDSLDQYSAVYYQSGNDIYFEIRKYKSHPAYTSTLYLSLCLEDSAIVETIKVVADAFNVPWTAAIWFWSEDISQLRPILVDNSGLREVEARELVLKAAARSPNKIVTMNQIRNNIEAMYPLSRADKVKSTTRPAEQLRQQILRNVVSHRSGQNSIFGLGYAEKIGNGIKITKNGLAHLKRLGFS